MSSVPPRPARPLPAVPNLEQQKKLARELLDAARADDAEARTRFRNHHPRLAGTPDEDLRSSPLSLHDAQLVLAREYGFASWPKLKAHIETAVAARRTRPIEPDLKYYDDRAHGLLEVLVDGAPSTLEQVRAWHPSFADSPDDAIRSAPIQGTFTIDDARLVYAREHGFVSWERFAQHLGRVRAGEVTEPFMQILEAGKSGDWKRVNALLRSHPELVRARGTNGNTLLNLACSMLACPAADVRNGDLAARLGGDRLAPVRLLVAAGAEPNQGNDRGWTPLHQAGYRNDPEIVALLLSAGARADLEAHGSGGTPLAVALFWGHREASERLAEVGVLPRNLRVTAGLGRPQLVRDCFTADGHLTVEACANRGFYRPHSGFPKWRQSDNSQEVLDEALVWASKSNRVEVMPFLVERGANVAADPYRGTPLLWAAANGRGAAARWLLDHGADVNQRATFGGEQHGQGVTALHLAAQNGNLAMVKLLLKRGGDPNVEDELYRSSPAGWAEHSGFAEVAAYFRNFRP